MRFAAFGLEVAEFGGIGFELTAKTAFLECEVAQVLLISAEDESFEHGGTNLRIGFVGAFGGEFVATEGVEAGFESGDAEKTPFGVGNGLGEMFFDVVGGLEFLVDERDEGLVGGDIVVWQQDGAAGEASFEGVVRGLGLAGFALWTGTELCVGAIGGELGFGDGVGWVGRRGGLTLGRALGGATDGSVRHSENSSEEMEKLAQVLGNLDELSDGTVAWVPPKTNQSWRDVCSKVLVSG